MFKSNIPKGFIKLLIIVLITVGMSGFANPTLASLWYIGILFWYFTSKDEPFWLAFFLITVDGFMGMMGVYRVVIYLFPGMPSIEVAQIYILLSVVKASKKKPLIPHFYRKYAGILLIYIIFMVLWGNFMGLEGEANVYFRALKLTLPFLLVYSLPRLLSNIEAYERLFGFLFPILILAFFTQVFTLITGITPTSSIEITQDEEFQSREFRNFYNSAITLMSLFGALFFSNIRSRSVFSNVYLNIIIMAAFGMALLSATRGWILAFSFVILLYLIISSKLNLRRIIGFGIVVSLLVFIGLSNKRVKEQVDFSTKRIYTLESIFSGDATAGGTLKRIDERGPRVIRKWEESPFLGWGFSSAYLEYQDSHVGNQTALLYSGIVGYSLLIFFILYFNVSIFTRLRHTSNSFKYRNTRAIFGIFILGWFMIHSSSGQHFNYIGIPLIVIPQAIFLSLGGLIYNYSLIEPRKQ